MPPADGNGVEGSVTGKRVMVTGGRGYIGPALCRALVSAGAVVDAVSRGGPKGEPEGVRWWQRDIADAAQVRELLDRTQPDVIFHLAGHAAGARRLDLVLPTFQSSLVTTVNVLTAATERGCERIVLAGSLEEPEAGEVEAVPSSPYAAGKWAASAYGRMFRALFDTPVVNTRIFMVYGPGRQSDQKLIPYVIRSFLRGETPQLSGGERAIDWVYIEDVAEGLVRVGSVPGLEGRTVDLGSGELVTVRQVVDQIAEIMGASAPPAFGAIAERPMEQVRVADTETTQALLGWRASTSLRDGLHATVSWYARRLT